jgi:surface polysaccharide O-acyltransferase-like enzyme
MLYSELFYKVIYIYGKLLYIVIYVVYGKLLVHVKGTITDQAETVPTRNMK